MRNGIIGKKEECELGLKFFLQHYWHVLEPGRPLVDGRVIDAICYHLEAVTDNQIRKLLINVPPGTMKPTCSTELVWSKRGYIPLKEINVGDFVLTHKGRFRKVLEVHHQGKLPVIKISTNYGRDICIAYDHPCLTPRGWINGENLIVGDNLASVTCNDEFDPVTVINILEEVRLVGYLIGDGSLTHTVGFTNKNEEILQDFEYCANKLGFKTRRELKHNGSYTHIYITAGRSSDKYEHKQKLNAFLDHYGLKGCNSYTKKIPDTIMNAPKEVVEHFLSAYWSCDGYVGIRHHSETKTAYLAFITTVGEDLAKQTLALMRRIGINVRLRIKYRSMETKRQKGGTYKSFEIKAMDQDQVAKIAALPKLCKDKKKCIPRTDFDHTLYPDEIISIEEFGEEECICLTVEEDQSFTVSGLAVHNSSIANVFWPTWEMGPLHRPWNRYVSLSYSHNLTRRDNRKSKAILLDPEFRDMWPHLRLSKDEANIDKWSTTKGGFRIASSIGGTVLGERGDRLILDDPNNIVRMEGLAEIEKVLHFLTEILPSRINDPEKSAIIIIMQRLHERDASGHILASELGFEHLMLPMYYEKERHCRTNVIIDDKGTTFEDWRTEEGELLWPERFTRKYLDEDFIPFLTSWGGQYAVAGQLQQRPVPRSGGLFKNDSFEIIEPHQVPKGGIVARGWDFAATSRKENPSAMYTSGVKTKYVNGVWYILHVEREQVGDDDLEDFVHITTVNDGVHVSVSIPQDPGAAGKVLKTAFIKRLVGYNVRSSPETGSKVIRAVPVAAQAKAGLIKLVKAPWNSAFIAEVSLFPNGTYKDQVDAMSRVFHHILKFQHVEGFAMPEVVEINGGSILSNSSMFSVNGHDEQDEMFSR